ncbi:endoribonuclease XendoU [Ostertagia ostertagi]
MEINNQPVVIFASTIKQDDGLVIDQCYPATSGHKPTKKPVPPTKRPVALVDKMRLADVDKAGPEDLQLKWGKKADKKYKDKLFVYVNETLFKRPVYSTLIEVYERNLFDPQVCHADSEMNGFRKAQLRLMFDTWTDTEVFKLAFDYLQNKDFKYATSMQTLKEYLWTLWFGTYSRCKGPYGSSGWEHVFYGEWKGTKVDGHHSWVRYYLQQKAGQIEYHGYYVYVPDIIGTVQYTWQKHTKPKGGFLIGTSPAF